MISFLFLLSSFLQEEQSSIQIYKASKVYTASEQGMLDNGIVVVDGQKILFVGKEQDEAVQSWLAKGYSITNLGRNWLVPGLVEPHNHIAGSLRDLNDTVFLTNPELHTNEVLTPNNVMMRDAVAGGVTSALFIPGSGSNMGGFGMLVKTAGGDTVEDIVVRGPGSLKVAQAGNPERYSFGVGRALMNWNTRDTLTKGLDWARAYDAGEAQWDPRYASFLGLAQGSVPVSVHTQIYQVVLTTLTMQVRDLGLKSFLTKV